MFSNLMIEAYRSDQLKSELLPSIANAVVMTVILDLIGRSLVMISSYFRTGSRRLIPSKLLILQYAIGNGVIL
jgi:hypothetical protein